MGLIEELNISLLDRHGIHLVKFEVILDFFQIMGYLLFRFELRLALGLSYKYEKFSFVLKTQKFLQNLSPQARLEYS